MRAFEYASPTTTQQAVALLASRWGETEVLAGGTDLLSLMKDDVVSPKRLVNIKQIRELQGITFNPKTGLRLGALVTIQQVLDDAQVQRHYPALHQAAQGIHSPQIRSMGTVGGDLCQRPRCWYYRAGFGLLAQDSSGQSLVLAGDNRYHAILGNAGPAYFVNPSSLAPPLIALGARLRIFGPKGARELPLEKFFLIPQSNAQREYDLQPNEIVTDILVPPAGGPSATYEVRQREALDWPLATASVALRLSGSKIQSARVVMGHVAPVPWVAVEAQRALAGKTINEEVAQAAARAAVATAKALSHNGYKIQLAQVAVKRAIMQAARGGVR
ncbi:MAG: xanthine dehydrogenase family protein subunit M [Acidobacteriota bacterium]|nr:xanthine dehydrogenase family protein subunit M [Blastocatellia bacterium]MDW8240256.1 xanthine dehydrogenase family protein subunit M [Acidobacteriota bacterium]